MDPAKMDYNWTTASKAAPVRFAKVPEGMKGVVGKEGFQPITGDNQVIAIDVKGQPYINTAQYVLDNTKGLDAQSIKALMEIDPSADASKAILDMARTESGMKELNSVGITVEKLHSYGDRDGYNYTHAITIDKTNTEGKLVTRTYIENTFDSDLGSSSKITTTKYNPDTNTPVETKTPNGIIEYDKNGLVIKTDIKNNYENLDIKDYVVYDIRDLTEKTKYGTHRKQIKIVNGFKVGIEEIPNRDGSTTVKLVNHEGQCVTRKIPKGKKYKIEARPNEGDVFVYEYGKTVDKETRMFTEKGYEPPISCLAEYNTKTYFVEYKHYESFSSDQTTPKTFLETNFFDE